MRLGTNLSSPIFGKEQIISAGSNLKIKRQKGVTCKYITKLEGRKGKGRNDHVDDIPKVYQGFLMIQQTNLMAISFVAKRFALKTENRLLVYTHLELSHVKKTKYHVVTHYVSQLRKNVQSLK